LIESENDIKNTFDSFNGSINNDDIIFVSQDVNKIVCCSIIKNTSELTASLDSIIIKNNYINKGIEINLINYITWELKRIGKKYLVISIEKIGKNNTWIKSIIGDLKIDAIYLKIDCFLNERGM